MVNSRAMLGRWLPSFCVWMWYGWPPSCLGYLGRGRGLPGLEVTIRYNQQSYLSHLWVLMAFYGLWPENIGAEYVHWNLSMASNPFCLASKNSPNMSKPLKSGTLKTPKFTRGISHQSLQIAPGSRISRGHQGATRIGRRGCKSPAPFPDFCWASRRARWCTSIGAKL